MPIWSSGVGLIADGTLYTPRELATIVVQATDKWLSLQALMKTRDDEFAAWTGGTLTGGYTDDTGTTLGGAYYPLTGLDGVVHYYLCPAAIAHGLDAKTDFSFPIQGAYEASEVIPILVASGNMTFSPTRCRAKSLSAFTASAVFTLYADAVAWATVTYSASGTDGVWVFSGDPSLTDSQVLTLHCPATVDATGKDLLFTLAGA
jgi:hypothetical protein